MSCEILHLSRPSVQSVNQIADHVIERFSGKLVPPQVVLNRTERAGTADVLLLALERYYMRNNSAACLTIQIIDDGQIQKAIVIGSGGGEGIFNLSWGANAGFANDAADILRELGFH